MHAAESSLGQARSLLDAVDSAATDIRHAVATLPSLIADIQSGIEHADAALQSAQKTKAPHLRDLASAREAAARALNDGAHQRFSRSARLVHRIDQGQRRTELAAGHGRRRAGHRRTTQPDTGAGVVHRAVAGARRVGVHRQPPRQCRTRGAYPTVRGEPTDRRRAGQKATDLNEAITHANNAASLAAQAQSLAEADVQSAQLAYTSRYGSGDHTGAMMGGIIIGDMLGDAMRGGFGGGGFDGGWGPTSFGGSGSSDGGFMGGGGRF